MQLEESKTERKQKSKKQREAEKQRQFDQSSKSASRSTETINTNVLRAINRRLPGCYTTVDMLYSSWNEERKPNGEEYNIFFVVKQR